MNYNYMFYGFMVAMTIWFLLRKGAWIKKVEQKTFCYCPACKIDLCSNDSRIYEHVKTQVIYKCKNKNCGNVSYWDFEIAPTPMLICSDEGSTDFPNGYGTTELHSEVEAEGGS